MATATVTYVNGDEETIENIDIYEVDVKDGVLSLELRDDAGGNPRGVIMLSTRNFRSIKFVPDAEDDI